MQTNAIQCLVYTVSDKSKQACQCFPPLNAKCYNDSKDISMRSCNMVQFNDMTDEGLQCLRGVYE